MLYVSRFMIINWYGEGCIKIQSGEFTILVDPFEGQTGLTAPRAKADVLIKTLTGAKNIGVTESEEHLIAGPGEYNIEEATITGFGVMQESTPEFIKTMYTVRLDEITVCLLGHSVETPSPEILEHLEEADILVIPGGGAPFMSQKTAVKLIKQIQPKIVIPTFFKIPGLKRASENIQTLLEEYGEKNTEKQEKLSIKKKELGEIKTTRIVVLTP